MKKEKCKHDGSVEHNIKKRVGKEFYCSDCNRKLSYKQAMLITRKMLTCSTKFKINEKGKKPIIWKRVCD